MIILFLFGIDSLGLVFNFNTVSAPCRAIFYVD